MDKLSRNIHKLLSDSTLRILHQNRISTVLEFLSEDVHKISTLIKLSLPQVIAMRCQLLAQFSADTKTGNDIRSDIDKNTFISTGINGLDLIIGGGIPLGCITEVCGLAGSGKTQLCFTLAIRTAAELECAILYIDTKGDFSAIAVQKYLENRGNIPEEMTKIMDLIKVVRVWNMNELVELLNQLKSGRRCINNLRLIVIDSLPCLMFPFLGDESKTGLTFLNKFVNLARYLCKENALAMVCVNVLTRWVEQTAQDNDDQKVILQGLPGKFSSVEKTYRCLGRYWQHIPALVLRIEMCSNNTRGSNVNILATVEKSAIAECDVSCNLNLSGIGIN